MYKYELILNIIKSKDLLFRALKIAFVVGIILNIINQGDYFLNMQFEHVNFIKAGLTFLVPFCVSMYTAVSMKLKFHVGEKSIEDVVLRCKVCNTCKTLKKEQIIPFCETCGEKTLWKLSSIKDKKCNNS